MFRARDVALVGVYTAVMLAAQFALSFVAGVEIVTLLTVCFAFSFGVKRSLAMVNCFSLLRCFIFGFFPAVVILYAVYYNLFVLPFGLLGHKLRDKTDLATVVLVTASATLCTAAFTFLDDLITPLFYGFSAHAAKAYFYSSLYPMLFQCICASVSVGVMFAPVVKIYSHFPIFAKSKKCAVRDNG